MLARTIVAVWGLLLSCAIVNAQVDQVDTYVKSQMETWHIPGMSVLVTRQGKVIFAKGYGLANTELAAPASPESVYMIGSITKNFTAVAALMLVEEGKVSLEEKITKYLIDIPNVPDQVMVRHLLTHTSGIVDYTEIPGSAAFARIDRPPREVVKPALAMPLRFMPGEKYEYSNTNYILLGMIIERAVNKSYGSFLRERIFQPLNMTATRMNELKAIIKNRVSGYNWVGDALLNAEYISPTNKWASGGIVSTVLDLAKWDEALAEGRLLKSATTQQMLSPAKLNDGAAINYGFGNELFVDRGRRVAGHGGDVAGFNGSLSRYVDDHLTVIVLCNLGDSPTEVFARHIAGLYLGLPDDSSAAKKAIEDKDPATTAMIKSVIQNAAKSFVDSSLFSSAAQNQLVPLIKRAGPEILGPLGQLESFTLLEQRKKGANRVLLYRAVFKEHSLVWTVELDANGKIVAMEPKPE